MIDTPSVKPRGPRLVGQSVGLVLLSGAAFALLQAACGDSTAVPDPAHLVLHVVSGDSQVGLAYEELPDPLVVRVIDTTRNEPVFNQVINFKAVEGDGSVFAGVAHTDEEGVAQEYWTLGAPGPQRLEARAVTSGGEKLVFGTFTATAVAPFDTAPAFVHCVGPDSTWSGQGDCNYGSHCVSSSVTAAFQVVNADSMPLPNLLVTFAVDTTVGGTMLQDGSVSPDSARTDSLGMVTATWTLGQYPGLNRLLVSVHAPGDVLTAEAWATGVSHTVSSDTVPAHILCLAQNGWWRFNGGCQYGPAAVSTTIPVSFQVVAADSTPLPYVPMFFVVDTTVLATRIQDGSVVPDSALTDSAGTVTVSWTLGQHGGENRLIAYAVGSGVTLTVDVSATGVPDSIPVDSVPAFIQCRDYHGIWRVDGNCAYQSVPAGTAFPVTFRVANADTVPLANVAMEFEITDGDGTVAPDSAVTDSLGEATVTWTVGSYNVGQQLTARVPSWMLEVSVRVGVQSPMPEKVWWQNAYGGDWTNPSNWSGGRVPRSGDTVVVSLSGTYTILAASDDTLAMGSLELGTADTNTTQTLYVDHTYFRVERFGAVHPSGVVHVDSGAVFGGDGLLFIVGGEVNLIDGTWAQDARVDSGAFVFEGASPKSLQGATLSGIGGSVVWRCADTLLFMEDSSSVFLLGADFVVEDTLTIIGDDASAGLFADSASALVFTTDSAQPNYLQMNGVSIVVNGEVAIEATAEPPPGTVFDLIRLIGGAVMTGTPTLVTSGYTLAVNPEAGVGLRAVKN